MSSIWTTDKTTLTTSGIMMINEAQAGNGGITITKAEIGGTFSTTAQLPNLTALPTPILEPPIVAVNTEDDGSRLDIVVSNSGVETGFNLCQIGIYATHPNVSSGAELLYFVSQSESPADFIPAGSVTVTSIPIKVYLKHSNVSDITFNIIDTFIPVATSQVLGGVMIGDGLSITESGVLSAIAPVISDTQPSLIAGQLWFEVL